MKYVPLAGAVYGYNQDQVTKTAPFQMMIKNVSTQIAEQKKTEEGKAFWDQRTFATTNITLPEPKDILPPLGWDWGKIGTYALIGVVAIAGVWLLGKYLGGKK